MNSLLDFLNESDVIKAFGISLLHTLWQGAGIAFLLWLALKTTSGFSAKTRYRLALLASCLLIGCFAYTFTLYLSAAEPVHESSKNYIYTIATSGQAESSVQEKTLALQLESQWAGLMDWLQQHVSYFILAWFSGFILYTARLTTGLFYLRRIERQSDLLPVYWLNKMQVLQQKLGLRAKVALVSSAKVSAPFTFGWLKPVIVIPASILTLLPADQVESILLHELAHIRRNDYLVNLLQNIAELFFFFNHGYWYIAHVLDSEREHVCDDLVVKHTGNYRSYAMALANLAQFPALEQNKLAMAAATKENSLLLRIKRIIHTSTSTTMIQKKDRNKSYLVTSLLIACSLFALIAIDVNGNSVKAAEIENMPLAETAPQQLTVTGVVLSENGIPLPGVSIMISNTTYGTITGTDGKSIK